MSVDVHPSLCGVILLLMSAVACGGAVRPAQEDSLSEPPATSASPSWSCAAGLESGAPWPMAGGCSALRHRATATGPGAPKLHWSFTTQNAVNGTPSIGADGTIYFGVQDELFALNADGSLKWTFTTPDGSWFYGEPAIAGDGTILDVALGEQAVLYAITKTGGVAWKYAQAIDPTINFATSPSVGPDGLVYFTLASGPEPSVGALYAIAAGGTLAWSTPSSGVMPAIGPGNVVYSQSNDMGSLQALGQGGVPQWVSPISPTSTTLAVGDDATIFVVQQGDSTLATAKNTLTALSASGALSYTFDLPYSDSAPELAIGANETTYLSPNQGPNDVLAFGASGSPLWQTALAASGPAPMDATNDVGGTVPLVDAAGTLYVGTTEGQVSNGPSCPCGHAVIPPAGAGLQALNADGTSAWTFQPAIAFGAPSMGADGTLYAATVGAGPRGAFAYAVVAVGE